MSIVQDALKKVGGNTAGGGSGEGPKRFGLFGVLLVLGLAGLIIFIFKQFSNAPMKDASTAGEAIYKPIAAIKSTDAARRNIQIASATSRERSQGFPEFALSGIMYLTNGPRAIVNNVIVGVGDVIAGGTVTKITKENVFIKTDRKEAVLAME